MKLMRGGSSRTSRNAIGFLADLRRSGPLKPYGCTPRRSFSEHVHGCPPCFLVSLDEPALGNCFVNTRRITE
jgi:hypothetical protein